MESHQVCLAFALTSGSESYDEWKWFLDSCCNHIQNLNSEKVGIISDRAKGKCAVKVCKVSLNHRADSSNCRIMSSCNISLVCKACPEKYSGSQGYKPWKFVHILLFVFVSHFLFSDTYWKMVETPSVREANEYWENLNEFPKMRGNTLLIIYCLFLMYSIQEYLENIGLKKITISLSPVARFSRTTNNYSEHWNSTLLKAREKPILHAIHLIMVCISTKQFERKKVVYSSESLNCWRKAISSRTERSRSHQVNQTGTLFFFI